LRGIGSAFNYPFIAEMRDYDVDLCRKMVYNSDVIVFHSAVLPYYQGLNLERDKLEGKKKLLYFHGSEMRERGDTLTKQADEIMGTHQSVISTPDLFNYASEPVKWLPVCRSFSEIRHRYGICSQDLHALEKYQVKKKKVLFCHAPTDEYKKGTATFKRVITQVMNKLPSINFLRISGQPWDSCLRFLSKADVYFDADAPFEYAYGAVSVEASIFHTPVVTKLSQPVIDRIHKETGLKSPFITFVDEDDLLVKAFHLGRDAGVRSQFGKLTYQYCKAVHDEKPVADRFIKIIEEMD